MGTLEIPVSQRKHFFCLVDKRSFQIDSITILRHEQNIGIKNLTVADPFVDSYHVQKFHFSRTNIKNAISSTVLIYIFKKSGDKNKQIKQLLDIY